MIIIRVRDWSELPRDISNLIGDRIKFLPHLEKFGVACKEWRDIADERNKIARAEIKSEPPMLLLPFNEETQMATFLEMIKGKKYNLKMPELKGQWICGASKGWLAMTDDNLDLFLFSPLTRARIKLPPLDP
ncbi:hypothetical protein LUZ60_010415 [Juncus effusus]|nr:hypothetical protein LUZ60_010415 [Juncus effusus]